MSQYVNPPDLDELQNEVALLNQQLAAMKAKNQPRPQQIPPPGPEYYQQFQPPLQPTTFTPPKPAPSFPPSQHGYIDKKLAAIEVHKANNKTVWAGIIATGGAFIVWVTSTFGTWVGAAAVAVTAAVGIYYTFMSTKEMRRLEAAYRFSPKNGYA